MDKNKASLVLYYSIMHAACHAMSDLKFGSCTALLSSSPVIEASKLVSRSQTPSLQLRRRHPRLSTHYIDDLEPYASLATGDVVKFFINIPFHTVSF